jgi:hypothetical protein
MGNEPDPRRWRALAVLCTAFFMVILDSANRARGGLHRRLRRLAGGIAEAEAGLAAGLNNTSFQIGGAVGVAILSTVAVSHANGPDPLAALTEGSQSAFAAAIAFSALGLLAALVLLGGPGRMLPQRSLPR